MGKEYAKSYSLPKVKFRCVRDTSKGRNAPKFFTYWADVPPSKRDLVKVKVYRLWPMCDLKALNPHATVEWDTFQGEIPFPPDEYESAFMHKYGSGEWNVVLGEEGVSGIIMEAYFSAIDREQFPPKIDFRTLIRGPFKNEEYIKWLERQPGLQLPWTVDKSKQEEEENMNVQNETITTLLESNDRKTEKIIEMVEEKIEDRSEQNSVENTAVNESIKMVTKTAETIVDGMAKQMDKVIEQSGKQVINPTEILASVVEVADKLRAPDTMSGVFEKLFELQREETKYWRERAETRQELAVPVEQPNGIDLLLQEGQKFKQLGDLFGWTGRRSRNDDEVPRQLEPPTPKESALDKLLGKLAENPAVLVTGIFAVTNLVQTFMGRGRPTEEVAKAAQQVAQGVTNGAIQPPSSPSPDEVQKQALANFLKAIHPLFIMHFFDEKKEGLTGYTFAEDFLTAQANEQGQLVFTPEGPMTELGQQQYNQIRQGGPIQFDRIIRDYTPIWSLVGGQMPRYTQFMKEFFEFPEAAQKAAEERRKEREKKVTQVPQPAN